MPVRYIFCWGVACLLMTGCSEKSVYTPSIADLNQRAQGMLASGQVEQAIGRLEAAHDLNPDEPATLFNLAVAYQTKGELEKAIPLLETLEQKGTFQPDAVKKTLGMVYEALADRHALKASHNGNGADGGMSQLSRDYYEKALGYYRTMSPMTEEIQAHIKQLEQVIQQPAS
jgi:predicted Zn-dependent protease